MNPTTKYLLISVLLLGIGVFITIHGFGKFGTLLVVLSLFSLFVSIVKDNK